MQYLDCSVLHKRLAPPGGFPDCRASGPEWSEPPTGPDG
jgi:hypothetical protein